MRRSCLTLALCLGLICLASWSAPMGRADESSAGTARGRVYEDANGNNQYDDGEKLLAGIRVSNGREVVKTDEQGNWQLPTDDDTIFFVIKPRGYRVAQDELNLSRFYYIHKPAGSPEQKFPGVKPTGPLPESIDFALTPQEEDDKFRVVYFGDTQPRNQQEIDYVAHDVVDTLIDVDAAFGVTLGDITFDDLSLFGSLNKTVSQIGRPWYNVIGNHDINYDADEDKYSDETFEATYGPPYYSYEYGPVHFVVLDDIEWRIGENGRKHYRGGLGQEQIEWLKNDLAQVPQDQMVVLMMHIPLNNVVDRQDVYRLIENRPHCISLSGHTHYHQHVFIGEEDGWRGEQPHHHIINVTVCGSWWGGQPDEYGIPHTMMRDGAPNGYSIVEFDGTDYVQTFQAARRLPEDQMNIIIPETVTPESAAETPLYVNVYNGSEKSTVRARFGEAGEWLTLEKVDEPDPSYLALLKREQALLGALSSMKWRTLPGAVKSGHLWKGTLPASPEVGTYSVQVETTDFHGRTHHGGRTIRVIEAEAGE